MGHERETGFQEAVMGKEIPDSGKQNDLLEKYYFKLQMSILNLRLLDGFQWVGKICKCLFSWRDGQ